MTEEVLYIPEKTGTENHFSVPEGYFEQFADRMARRLPADKPKARLVPLRTWFYAAACVAAVVVMGLTFHFQPSAADDVPAVMASVTDNTFMEEAADYAMIDNMEIYACLSDN